MLLRLFWWNDNNNGYYNYGDLISKYLVKKISKRIVVSSNSKYNRIIIKFYKSYYLCVGSILFAASDNSKVWGSGILSKEENVKGAKFYAVRGPETRKRLMSLGYEVPEVYGDPALLMPLYYNESTKKKYELGVIPHIVDYEMVKKHLGHDKRVKIIKLLTKDVEGTTKEILECKTILSSSLHGVIVPHAYGIPALWVKFSNNLAGDNIKFIDYYKSVQISFKEEIKVTENQLSLIYLLGLHKKYSNLLLPEKKVVASIQKKLIKVCPFN
ncbi:polysaccharide pyruvyl transferase family protein [Tamlana crocina]|uniref:Polysaccharide pyruvyl transferase family protein n=1 Tax=Tamlana crocina TaxID=393006 RepID=A0ABX1D9K4_9FLAO|nr:polysaccharide pyruvyl transferase family protein [Tamlana crocina]NJX15039.1 polysaccharide pyruvyl transferase family protein [Tamlana crocina]